MSDAYYSHPLGRARVARQGDAATLIFYGGMVENCECAAKVAEREGVALEV